VLPQPTRAPFVIGAPLAGAAQYRGVSYAPITPTCGLSVPGTCCSPGMPGYYCAGGALPLLPCTPGSASTGGLSTTCPLCGARIRLGAGESASSARGAAAVNAHLDDCLRVASARRAKAGAAGAGAAR
jgi:hypothetical protein